MQMGEAYWVEKNRSMAGIWFSKAAGLASQFAECDNADLLNSVARAYLRYCAWLVGEDRVRLAKRYLYRTIEVLSFELKIRNDPVLSNLAYRKRRMEEKIRENLEKSEDEAVQVVDKNLVRIQHATKMLALVFAYLGYCYDVQGRFAKTLECNRMSLIVVNSLDRRKSNYDDKSADRRGTSEGYFRRLLYSNEEKYKVLVEEEREIERILEVNYWRFGLFPGVELTLPELRLQDYMSEDLRKVKNKLRHSMAVRERSEQPAVNRELSIKKEDMSISLDSSVLSKNRGRDGRDKKVVFTLEVQEAGKLKNQSRLTGSKVRTKERSEGSPQQELNNSGNSWRIKRRKKLEWTDDSNYKLKYDQPVSDYFDKTVLSNFKSYLKAKDVVKAEADVNNLDKDKFWQLRRKRVMKYDEVMDTPATAKTEAYPSQAERSLVEEQGDINALKKTLEMDNYFSKTIGQLHFKQTGEKISFNK